MLMSQALKKETSSPSRYSQMLYASASVECIKRMSTSSFEDSFRRLANFEPSFFVLPTIILDGCKLSYSALPLKNSGEKKIPLVPNFF